MNAKELKEKLTVEHILELMVDFDTEPRFGRSDNELIFRTVCHGGDSHKLYFYKNTMNFHCYTHCGSMDILQLVQNIMGLDLPQAINYIADRFGFKHTEFHYGFGEQTTDLEDWNIIKSYKTKQTKVESWKEFKVINENVLNNFYNYYHKSFLLDGISKKTMDKFEIKFDVLNNRIIIPHRYTNGDLIAIRCRNLEEHLVNTGRKYMPIVLDGKTLSAPTGQYFYGLFQNIENIKKTKRVILVESEKAVMQFETMYPNNNIALALSSSNLSQYQIDILKDLGVEEVIIALDKEYEKSGTREEMVYALKVDKSLVSKLSLFNVSVIWDFSGLINKKDSPLDRGKEVFNKLYNNRIDKHRWEKMINEVYTKR